MPGNASRAKGVRCPFWVSSDGASRIVCEAFESGCHPGLLFADERICRAYRVTVCSGRYQECPLYQGLMATKYRED